MSRAQGGGAAFPHAPINMGMNHIPAHPGMLLRDWFAGMAVAGLLANTSTDEMTIPNIARMAYDTADAMLKAGGKP